MSYEVVVREQPLHGQDRWFARSDGTLVAIFDGVGAYHASGEAADAARAAVASSSDEDELVHVLEDAQPWVAATGGATTAVAVRIAHDSIIYASIGDSRLYVLEGDPVRAILITRDEGQGRFLDNWLGTDGNFHGVRQSGTRELTHPSVILLVTDGITGDVEPDILTEEDIAECFRDRSVEDACDALLERSTKADDKTIVAVQIA